MSFKAVTWAFDEVVGLSQGEKLVLLALAEFANDDNETWRSREAIAARALCSMRSVSSHLKVLETRGLVSRSARFAWCEDTAVECATRGRHKHRVGTLYKLHLDVTGAGGSTHANSASVENCPECRGSGHTCKICTCGGDEGSTHAKSRSPHMQPVAGITNRNYPPIKPPPSPQPPTGAVGDRDGMGRKVENLPGLGAAGGSAAAREGGPALGLSSEQVSLLVSSLPDSMCVLSAEGMARVWRSLAPRLAAGWSPHQVRSQLAMRALPSEVRIAPWWSGQVTPESAHTIAESIYAQAEQIMKNQAREKLGEINSEIEGQTLYQAAAEHIQTLQRHELYKAIGVFGNFKFTAQSSSSSQPIHPPKINQPKRGRSL